MSAFVRIAIGAALVAGVILTGGALAPALATFLISAGASLAIGGVGSLLSGKKEGLSSASRNPIAPWNVVYGRARIGGTIVYIEENGDDNKYLYMVLVLACHPCQSVDALLFDSQRVLLDANGNSYTPHQQQIDIATIARANGVVSATLTAPLDSLDGQTVLIHNVSDRSFNGQYQVTQGSNPNGFTYICGGNDSASHGGYIKTTYPDYQDKVHMEVLLGDHASTFPGLLHDSNGFWTAQHLLAGCTAVYLKLHYNDKVFANGLPNISFLVHGKADIFDPRKGSYPTAIVQRPTILLNGWGNNAHAGPYEEGSDQATNWGLNDDTTYAYVNADRAVDGDASSYASIAFAHTHKYAGCIWSFATQPSGNAALYLNVRSEVPAAVNGNPSTKRSAGIWYSLDNGATFKPIYNSSVRRTNWDSVPLPSSQDLGKVQVMAFTDAHDDMAHNVFDIHIANGVYQSSYSENAALCIADYLAHPVWGFKAAYAVEIPTMPLIAAANTCDEAVPLAKGGTEPRYTCNGTFQLTTKRGEILQNLLTSCGGRLTYTGGQFEIHPAAWPGVSSLLGGDPGFGAPLIVPNGPGIFQVDWEDQPYGDDYAFGDGILRIVFDGAGGATMEFLGDTEEGTAVANNDYGVDGQKLVGTNFGPGPTAILNIPAPGQEMILECFVPNGNIYYSGAAAHNYDNCVHCRITEQPVTSNPNFGNVPSGSLAQASGPFLWKPKLSVRDLYNGVKGIYVSPANNWQSSDIPPYAQDRRHGYINGPAQYNYDANVAADGGERRWLEIQLPFTILPATAQRLCKIELLRRRQQGIGTFAFNLAMYRTTVLDVIQFSFPPLGWGGKLLEITAHRFTQTRQQEGGAVLLGTEIDVQETNLLLYDWHPSEELTPQGYQQATLPSTNFTAPPRNVVMTSGPSTAAVGADGFARSRILVTWIPPADGYVLNGGHIEASYQRVGESGWTGLQKLDPSLTQLYIDGVNDGAQYLVQIRAVNAAGVPSAWTVAGPELVSNTVSQIRYGALTDAPVFTVNGK